MARATRSGEKAEKDFVVVRCSPEQRTRVDGIVAALEGRFPVVKRAAIMRKALELGLDRLEKDPKALLSA